MEKDLAVKIRLELVNKMRQFQWQILKNNKTQKSTSEASIFARKSLDQEALEKSGHVSMS